MSENIMSDAMREQMLLSLTVAFGKFSGKPLKVLECARGVHQKQFEGVISFLEALHHNLTEMKLDGENAEFVRAIHELEQTFMNVCDQFHEQIEEGR